MTDQTNKERAIRDAFEDSRRQGLNTDWLTFQIAWAYADAALSASAPAAGSVPDLTDEAINEIAQAYFHQDDTDLADVRCAIRTALREQRALLAQYGSPAWQPIETAPHETPVLLSWVEWDGEWKFEVGPASWGWRTPTVSNMSRHGRATHWMPLPPAPQEGK